MFKDKSILITGGTGSFGSAFSKTILERFNPRKLIVFSRDEMKQWEMAKLFKDDSRVRFFIGDVRDKDRLHRALDNVDFVAHAAASKIVPTAEYNPFEVIKTNIIGSQNVIDSAIACKVKKVIALSTDKAAYPINSMGMSKALMEKVMIAKSRSTPNDSTIYCGTRYGNVMGSRGSIIPYFLSIKDQKELPITDKRMTRFMISLDQSVKFVWHAFKDMLGDNVEENIIEKDGSSICEVQNEPKEKSYNEGSVSALK